MSNEERGGEAVASCSIERTRFPYQRLLGVGALAGVLAAAVVVLASREHAAERLAASDPPYRVMGEQIEIPTGAPSWKYVEFAEAQVGTPLEPVPVPGRVGFDEARSQPIVAPLPGRVETVTARLGQHISAGDRLVAVRSTALVDLFKEIDLLRADEAAKRKTVERLQALVGLKAVAEKDLVAAQAELHQALLTREAAELKLRSLPINADGDGLYWLTSGRPGAVVERTALIGQEVGPDRSEPLFVIADLDEVIVAADVPEVEVAGIEVGQAASVFTPATPDQPLIGRVEYVGEVIDPLRRMVNVRIRVANADRQLRPNAFVQVGFGTSGPVRIVLPAEAVVTDDQRSFVFVRSAAQPQRLERRLVSVGRRSQGEVEVVSGLAPGETYVAKGALLLLNAVDLVAS